MYRKQAVIFSQGVTKVQHLCEIFKLLHMCNIFGGGGGWNRFSTKSVAPKTQK